MRGRCNGADSDATKVEVGVELQSTEAVQNEAQPEAAEEPAAVDGDNLAASESPDMVGPPSPELSVIDEAVPEEQAAAEVLDALSPVGDGELNSTWASETKVVDLGDLNETTMAALRMDPGAASEPTV